MRFPAITRVAKGILVQHPIDRSTTDYNDPLPLWPSKRARLINSSKYCSSADNIILKILLL